MGGKPYDYKLVEVTSETELNPYGKPKRIGTRLEIDPVKAAVIVEIFTLYADGWSPQSIAAELNRRGIAAPGAAWTNTARNQAASGCRAPSPPTPSGAWG